MWGVGSEQMSKVVVALQLFIAVEIIISTGVVQLAEVGKAEAPKQMRVMCADKLGFGYPNFVLLNHDC